MDRGFYFDHLYPLQDQVLQSISRGDEGFYLTGGTAASRGYLNHRFSDDQAAERLAPYWARWIVAGEIRPLDGAADLARMVPCEAVAELREF